MLTTLRAALFSSLGLLLGCNYNVPEFHGYHIQYVATARQFGPVSFRDPLGAQSPDGRWLAWSVQQHLYLQPLPAGPVTAVPSDGGVIVHLTWTADSRQVVIDRRGAAPRWRAWDVAKGTETPLWRPSLRLRATPEGGSPQETQPDSLRQLAWSKDGNRIAGIRSLVTGSELWSFTPAGDSARVIHSVERLLYPVFSPKGTIVCLADDGSFPTIEIPCGDSEAGPTGLQSYGPIAFSPDGLTIYYSRPDAKGVEMLVTEPLANSATVQLTTFAGDTYWPTAAANGSVLFKTQHYSTMVGVVPASGGIVRMLSAFQSETPSWDPTGKLIGITYGSWRRASDDYHYPDIAQDIGLIPADADSAVAAPSSTIDASPSEDQSLCWSPNGKWIAYHSHKEAGDDIWLVPADLSRPARRLTSFGRGAETGWPRWSPDGKWLAFDADAPGAKPARSVIWLLGIDQSSGVVTSPARAVTLAGFAGDAVHAEWLPDSERLGVLGEEGPGRWALLVASKQGGGARVVHRWQSEHRFAGIGVSPDGAWAAFIAPDAGGYFQLFRIGLGGGAPEQLTFDPTNKTQPSYSPDGRRIALTIWSYEVQFWMLK